MSVTVEPVFAFAPGTICFRSSERRDVRSLDGYNRKQHQIPREHSAYANNFIIRLLEEELRETSKEVYRGAKRELSLRRRDVVRTVEDGGATVDTSVFRYVMEVRQDPEDPAAAQLQHVITPRVAPDELPAAFDEIFPISPDELVISLSVSGRFDDLVDHFEDLQEQGLVQDLEEDEDTGEILFSAGRLQVCIHTVNGELVLQAPGVQGCTALLSAIGQSMGETWEASWALLTAAE